VPKIKGLAFREFVRWYNTEHGPSVLQASAQALPNDLRAQLDVSRADFGILAGSWYPVVMATTFLEAISRGLSPEQRMEVLRGATDQALGNMLTGVYRSLFEKLVTPERHARYAQNIFRTFYNTGTVVGEVRGPAARAHIDACAQRYMGVDYPGEIGSERVILQIAPLRQRSQGL